MKYLLIFFTISATFIACTKTDEVPSPFANPEVREVNLQNPSPDQKSVFVHYTMICGTPDSYSETGDTLILTVVERNDSLYLHETFTAGSSNFSRNAVASYPVYPRAEYTLIPYRAESYLFYFFGNDTLKTSGNPDTDLYQEDCHLVYPDDSLFIGEELGSLATLDLDENRYTSNWAVSCVPVILDIDAYLIYNQKELKVSHVVRPEGGSFAVDGFRCLK